MCGLTQILTSRCDGTGHPIHDVQARRGHKLASSPSTVAQRSAGGITACVDAAALAIATTASRRGVVVRDVPLGSTASNPSRFLTQRYPMDGLIPPLHIDGVLPRCDYPLHSMKIATWNVNGIRARQAELHELAGRASGPTSLCLQEIKASPDQLPVVAPRHGALLVLLARRQGLLGRGAAGAQGPSPKRPQFMHPALRLTRPGSSACTWTAWSWPRSTCPTAARTSPPRCSSSSARCLRRRAHARAAR